MQASLEEFANNISKGTILTKQEHRDECDVNLIVKRAQKGIAPAWVNSVPPRFGDFSSIPTLEEAHDRIVEAQEAFMTLPAKLRLELGNDPKRIDELTVEQLDRHGLIVKRTEGTPSAAPESEVEPQKPAKPAKSGSSES